MAWGGLQNGYELETKTPLECSMGVVARDMYGHRTARTRSL